MTVEDYEGREASADNIRRLIGVNGAQMLSAALGGHRVYVPRAPGAHHCLTVAVGQECANKLAAAFHGDEIDIPMSPARQREIRRLNAEGKTRRQIATLVGCSERWVYKTLEDGEKSPDPQPRLQFG